MIIFTSHKSRALSKFGFLDPCPTEFPIKFLLSVCLSVRPPVHQQFGIFIRNELLAFFRFFALS